MSDTEPTVTLRLTIMTADAKVLLHTRQLGDDDIADAGDAAAAWAEAVGLGPVKLAEPGTRPAAAPWASHLAVLTMTVTRTTNGRHNTTQTDDPLVLFAPLSVL